MTQGQSHEGPHKQNVQLGGAAELKKWDKRIGPRDGERVRLFTRRAFD